MKRLLHKVARALRGNSKGQLLIEVLIALTILAIIAIAFLCGLSTAYKGLIIADERTTAESLTRSELEYVKSVSYTDIAGGFCYNLPDDPPSWDYDHALAPEFSNYSVEVTGVPIDPDTHEPLTDGEEDQGIQQITVEVYHSDKLVLTTSDYKVDR